MLWKGQRESENVEDQRGSSGQGLMIGGGVGSIIVVVVALLLGINPQAVLDKMHGDQQQHVQDQGKQAPNPAEDELVSFVKVVLADTEDVWEEQFRKRGDTYRKPKLVLFTGKVRSACGLADTAVGPFYCPGDEKVYLDLSFFRELRSRFKAPGEFAQAYVIAHEVGHHVQKLRGTMDKVHAMQARAGKTEANRLSVRLELQADFYAGVWAHHAQQMKKIMQPGDLESALQAANAIGDDRLQMEGRGYVVPDSFTHGTSAQRIKWFKLGFDTGDMDKGDTFNAKDL
jgi:predicted metalloprotease